MSDSSSPATRLALTAALAAGAGVAAGWYLHAEYPSLVSSAFARKAGKKKKRKGSRWEKKKTSILLISKKLIYTNPRKLGWN